MLNKLLKYFLTLFILLVIIPVKVMSYISTALPSLLVEPSAKAIGLGGAYTALAGDATAMYYNPAGLTRIKLISLETSYHKHLPNFSGEPQYFVGGAINIRKFGFIGIQYKYSKFSEQCHTDVIGTTTCFKTNDQVFGLSYAKSLNDNISIGSSIKYIDGTLHSNDDDVWAFDIGIIYQNLFTDQTFPKHNNTNNKTWAKRRIPPGLSLGCSISNIGGKIWDMPLPQNFRFGLAWNFAGSDIFEWILAADVQKLLVKQNADYTYDSWAKALFTGWEGGLNDAIYSFGIEGDILSFASVRLGYYYDNPGKIKYTVLGIALGPERINLNLSHIFATTGSPIDKTTYIGFSFAY